MCNTFIETFYNIPKYDEVSDSSMNSKKKKMASSFVSSLGFSRNSIELQDVTTFRVKIFTTPLIFFVTLFYKILFIKKDTLNNLYFLELDNSDMIYV